MADLRGQAAGSKPSGVEDTRRAWGQSMTRRMDQLRAQLAQAEPAQLAARAGAGYTKASIRLQYWGRWVELRWPALEATRPDDGQPCSTFDTAMLLYYLATADGTPIANHWIGFRELPDGAFYNQAFQGYSGEPLARALHTQPSAFARACAACGGQPVLGLAPYAFSFLPLPRLPLTAALWPGDEDLPGRAAVLFDAAASHYLTTDGLALLGSGLAGRLLRSASGA